jgi:hypothetical protein
MSLPIIPGPNNELITASAAPTYGSSANYTQYTQGSISMATTGDFPKIVVSGSISTYGNPVLIMCSGDAAPNPLGYGEIQLYREDTAIGQPITFQGSSGGENSPYSISYVDPVSAGTYNYYLKVNSLSSNASFGESSGPNLILIELSRV